LGSSPLKWPLHITPSRSDGVLVLALSGRLGGISTGALTAALDDAIGHGDVRLVLDLTEMDYVSSAGLQSIGAAAARCTALNGGLALCGVAAAVRIALELAGMLNLVAVEASREAAVGRLRTLS
jgi:stage II sporulation protein AA (anti-sigma F factor antagonist)